MLNVNQRVKINHTKQCGTIKRVVVISNKFKLYHVLLDGGGLLVYSYNELSSLEVSNN